MSGGMGCCARRAERAAAPRGAVTRERLQALGGAAGTPVGVAGQTLPPANRRQAPNQLCLLGTAPIVTHSISSDYFL
jgi:hypothetical protein